MYLLWQRVTGCEIIEFAAGVYLTKPNNYWTSVRKAIYINNLTILRVGVRMLM